MSQNTRYIAVDDYGCEAAHQLVDVEYNGFSHITSLYWSVLNRLEVDCPAEKQKEFSDFLFNNAKTLKNGTEKQKDALGKQIKSKLWEIFNSFRVPFGRGYSDHVEEPSIVSKLEYNDYGRKLSFSLYKDNVVMTNQISCHQASEGIDDEIADEKLILWGDLMLSIHPRMVKYNYSKIMNLTNFMVAEELYTYALDKGIGCICKKVPLSKWDRDHHIFYNTQDIINDKRSEDVCALVPEINKNWVFSVLASSTDKKLHRVNLAAISHYLDTEENLFSQDFLTALSVCRTLQYF